MKLGENRSPKIRVIYEGKPHVFDLLPKDSTMKGLKALINIELGVAVERQELIHHGKVISDDNATMLSLYSSHYGGCTVICKDKEKKAEPPAVTKIAPTATKCIPLLRIAYGEGISIRVGTSYENIDDTITIGDLKQLITSGYHDLKADMYELVHSSSGEVLEDSRILASYNFPIEGNFENSLNFIARGKTKEVATVAERKAAAQPKPPVGTPINPFPILIGFVGGGVLPLAYYAWKAHSNSGIGTIFKEASPKIIVICALLGAAIGVIYNRDQSKDNTGIA